MKLKTIAVIASILALFFAAGWFFGRHSGRRVIAPVNADRIEGVVPTETVAAGMAETKPDTVYIPVPVPGPERIVYSTVMQPTAPEVVPIQTVAPGAERNEAIEAALLDWNTKRAYTGVLFDDPRLGTATYGFEVQFNRAGQIDYHFEPAPAPTPRLRLRPMVGGEYYTNGQYAFGGGVQYGAFGLNIRALKLPGSAKETGYAFGVGVQIIF